MRAMSIAYQIELPDDLASRLEVMAKDMGLSLGAVFKGAVTEQLEDYEDALEALRRRNDSDAEYVTTDELCKNLGLLDTVE